MLKRVLVRDRVVDRGDDVADVALARRVEHFLDEQRRARRDAAAAPVGVVAVARDDARDVRAVAVVVVRGRLEIRRSRRSGPRGCEPRSSCQLATPESMIAMPTPVPSTPRFSRTQVAPTVAPVRSSVPCTRPVEADAGHAGQAGQFVERRVGDVRDLAATERQAPAGRAAKPRIEAVGRRAVGGLDDDP